MKKWDNKKLKEILKKINTDPQTQMIYDSKLNRVMNYIQKTAGFKIAAIKEGGSRGKQTTSIFSLLEFIIMNKDLNDNIIRNKIEILIIFFIMI